jgi:ParB/RepB/Spo0J family partition protein
MAEVVQLADPRRLKENPENPRLIFRQDELLELQDSIKQLGILVPLSVYRRKKDNQFVILDGARRLRCALKLGLHRVPLIIQPEPSRLQNIMLMFAIHGTRREWDPLPTAKKLTELEEEYARTQGRKPSEPELAQLASMPRGQVRRLKKLLALPKSYQDELMEELEKPKLEQTITVDQVLETTKGVEALAKRKIIPSSDEEPLRRAILDKFRKKIITNTVAPRKLARLARAVEREEIPLNTARRVVQQLAKDPKYTIDAAFTESVEHVDFEHGTVQLVERLVLRLTEQQQRRYAVGRELSTALRELLEALRRLGIR